MSRYIDAEKIPYDYVNERGVPMTRQIDVHNVRTADVRENVRGEWKEVYAETDYRNGWIEFTCENCEYQHGLESGEYGWSYGEDIPWRFCPICGARMVM